MGFTFNTGPELEFFLFKMFDGRPTTEFQDHGGYFDLAPTDLAEDVRQDIVLALSEMGFEIEASHHEVADSQHEIDFKYGDALNTADRVITFKFATKSIALKYDLHASFMAKPIAGINGSGMHTHGSLARVARMHSMIQMQNWSSQIPPCTISAVSLNMQKQSPGLQIRPSTRTNGLSPAMKHPVTFHGVQPTARPLSEFLQPVETVPGRVPSPDPMCNPYLTFACMLAAGLDGIKNKIMPPE